MIDDGAIKISNAEKNYNHLPASISNSRCGLIIHCCEICLRALPSLIITYFLLLKGTPHWHHTDPSLLVETSLLQRDIMMATVMTSDVSSTQAITTLPTTPSGFQTTGANSTLSNIGFIVSLCIVHQCAVYRDKSITLFSIRQNYDIVEIPAEAFVGATNIEVCQNNIYVIIQSSTIHLPMQRCVAKCLFH